MAPNPMSRSETLASALSDLRQAEGACMGSWEIEVERRNNSVLVGKAACARVLRDAIRKLKKLDPQLTKPAARPK